MHRFEARSKIISALKKKGFYRGLKDNPMVLPVCRYVCIYNIFHSIRMSDRGVTRWPHNRVYTQPAHTHKSLICHLQYSLVYNFEIVYVTVMKLIALIFYD